MEKVNKKNISVLISGIGGPTPLGIAKSLKMYFKNIKIIGIDCNKYAPGLYRRDLFNSTYLVPNSSEENYWEEVNKIVSKEKIDFAFIVPETEVIQWSKRNSNEGIPCSSLVPDYEVSSFIFDKLILSNYLEKFDLTPKTLKVSSSGNFYNLEKEFKYPYWVRLNKTAGALGALKINCLNDIENWIKINSFNSDIIASEFLPGRNYACKLLYINGKLISSASGERIEYLLPNSTPTKISGMCARGVLINREDLIKKSMMALDSVYKHFNKSIHGMFTVDFKESINGIPLITEINLRHVSFTHAFSLAGINFPAITLMASMNQLFEIEKYHKFDHEYNFIEV